MISSRTSFSSATADPLPGATQRTSHEALIARSSVPATDRMRSDSVNDVGKNSVAVALTTTCAGRPGSAPVAGGSPEICSSAPAVFAGVLKRRNLREVRARSGGDPPLERLAADRSVVVQVGVADGVLLEHRPLAEHAAHVVASSDRLLRRYSCTTAMHVAPSPTADATRLMER